MQKPSEPTLFSRCLWNCIMQKLEEYRKMILGCATETATTMIKALNDPGMDKGNTIAQIGQSILLWRMPTMSGVGRRHT